MSEPAEAKSKTGIMVKRLAGAAFVALIAFAAPWSLAWLAGRGLRLGMVAVSPLVFLWPACAPFAALLFRRAGAAAMIILGLITFGLSFVGLKSLRPVDGFVSGLSIAVSSSRSPEQWRQIARETAAQAGPSADEDSAPLRFGSDELPSVVKLIGPGLHTGFLSFTENGQPGGLTAYGGGGHLHWGIKISITSTTGAPSGINREVSKGIWVFVD